MFVHTLNWYTVHVWSSQYTNGLSEDIPCNIRGKQSISGHSLHTRQVTCSVVEVAIIGKVSNPPLYKAREFDTTGKVGPHSLGGDHRVRVLSNWVEGPNDYKWKNHFHDMKGDVGMSSHEKEREQEDAYTKTESHS